MATPRSRDVDGWVTVWDPLVRLFHWGLAATVIIALMSDENRSLHEAVGYAAAGLVLVRLAWGFVGSPHARFADFVRSPGAVLAYLKDVARLRAPRHLGHNPAGGAMIVALLGLVLLAAFSGWLQGTDLFFAVGWVENLHAASANLLIVLVVLHVAGVVASSLFHRENLLRAMITGRKPLDVSPGRIAEETEKA
jgi:cytochrome b